MKRLCCMKIGRKCFTIDELVIMAARVGPTTRIIVGREDAVEVV